jgi:thiol-disulfide isomerase/thioredoxin
MKKVVLYYANWCGHCMDFKPVWDELKTKLDEKNIRHDEHEHETSSDLMKARGIKGFPTIRFENNKNDDYTVYKGERTIDAILKALDEIKGGGKSHHLKYLKYKIKYLKLKNKLE